MASQKIIKVLVIEDDPAYERIVRNMLENASYSFDVYNAVSLADGLELIHNCSPDVVLLDLGLPDSDGFATFNAVYSHAPDLAIVILTAADDDSIAQTVVQKGAQDYLFKPKLTSTLLERAVYYAHMRKLAEEALRKSDARYRLLAENIAESIWTMSFEGRFTYISPSTQRISGYTQEEYAEKSLEDLLTPESLARVMEAIAVELARDHEPGVDPERRVVQEVEQIHKNGHRYWTEATASFIRDKTGKPVAIMGSTRDINERKQAEEALRQSEERYRRLVDNTDTGFVVIDDRGIVITANDPYIRLAGKKELGDVAGHSVIEWTAPEEMESNANAVALCSEQGYIEDFETVYQHGDGKRIPICINAAVQMTDDGGKQLVSFCRDISDRKRAEATLRRNEERLSDIISSMADLVWEVDSNGAYTYCSEKVSHFLGRSQEEVIGMTPFDFMPPDEARRVAAIFSKIAASKEPIKDLENWNIRTDGKRICLLTNGVPILDKEGNLKGYRGVDQDITDRKQAEEEKKKLTAQLVQAQKLESVGRLAGGVAHEFNNMLGVILGYAEMAMSQINPEEPVQEDLKEIKKAANRSAEIARQLLTYARRQIISPKILDLNKTISGMINMLRRLIGENIDLVWRPGSGLWPIKMDPAQVEQILTNLSINARDAIAGIGTLLIETQIAVFDEASCSAHPGLKPGEYVMLLVSDSGWGMNKEDMEHLFEPFFTTKDVGEGTGLGLATIYGIIKQNNAFIYVFSEPEQGTTFKLYFPRVADSVEAKPAIIEPEPICGDETVLLVEDERALLNLTKAILGHYGYQVLPAESYKEALDTAERHEGPIQLLITDVVMPGMNGRDLKEKIKALHPEIKVIFMSGYSSEVLATHGAVEKDINFLQKPISKKRLASKVREVLDKK
ncbi:MAG: PAS domain S-box protein [Nitrospirota bacterium]